MIIFNAAGRFGNQVFQFFFCESIKRKNERIFSLGFNDLFTYIVKPKYYYNTDNRHIVRFFNVIARRILIILSKVKIITIIYENNDREISIKKGLLPIKYVYGYFQTEIFINQSKLQFKACYLNKAKEILNTISNPKLYNSFIHIRHGDYSDYMRLDQNYYINALNVFLKKTNLPLEKINFIIFGDDIEFAKNIFGFLPNKHFSQQSFIIDFLLIILLEGGGIISNSTFAWLAAFLQNNHLPIIGPKYWTGFKKKYWDIPQLYTKRFDFIEF